MGIKYSTIAISGYNSAPPSDSGAQTDENKIKWSTHKTKIGDPLNAAIVAIDSALVTAFAQEALLKTTNYTTTAGDNGKLLEVTGTNTISLYDASTGGASYQINVLNTGVGVVTVGRATAGNTINGVAGNWTLNPGNGASFRVNSTNNGYDVIATALTTGSSLADVVHVTGNESIAGIKTFTTGSPIAMSSTVPAIQGRNTSLTLPAGAWRMLWPASDDTFYLQKNTAAGGDFSTVTNLFYIGSTQAVINVPITIPNGVASTDAVNKSQLDAKVYGGQVTNAGTAAIPYGPSGWTVNRVSAGIVTLTHNLATTNYAIVATPNTGGYTAIWSSLAANTVVINTYNAAGAATDTGFNFVVARN